MLSSSKSYTIKTVSLSLFVHNANVVLTMRIPLYVLPMKRTSVSNQLTVIISKNSASKRAFTTTQHYGFLMAVIQASLVLTWYRTWVKIMKLPAKKMQKRGRIDKYQNRKNRAKNNHKLIPYYWLTRKPEWKSLKSASMSYKSK